MPRTSPIKGAQAASIWSKTAKMPSHRRLSSNIDVDVCVVGAGIAGLTTAYLLTKAGRRVAVLDDGPLVSGMTQVTTAHLSNVIDDGLGKLEQWHGLDAARLAVQSHEAAIDCIESIVAELDAECDFKRIDGYLFAASPEDSEFVRNEFEVAKRLGFDNAELIDEAPLSGGSTRATIRFPHQARFHPMSYLAAVARAIKAGGGRLFTNSHADNITGGDRAEISVGDFRVKADAVVVATNTPVNDLVAIHTKQAPYMTYVVGMRVPRGRISDALYWDTLDAYHYVRLQPLNSRADESSGSNKDEYDLLIVGGEDHKTGQADDSDERHRRLEQWTRVHFPEALDVEFTWGGQVMETIDGLAFIGRNPMDKDNVYIATGDSGMGITHGTIAGMLLCDLILGKKNPWEDLYDPSRKNVRAAGTFLKENLNVAGRYAEWLTSGEVDSADEIPHNCGAVIRRGLSKVAIYRDGQGATHELSAVCPHLQCIVHWNPAESTWDCPCHGSRFRPTGEVINGPANKDLEPVKHGES